MEYDYNTSRKKLILPEYGRHIHKMIDHICTIEDREERNKAAKTIIAVMGNLNPHLRDVADFKHKLWDHLAVISEFKLDIDSPYEKPEPTKFQEKPSKVEYNQNNLKYKHYGKSVSLMIEAAAAMEEGEEREHLVKLLANHLKKLYLTWNREAVEDEQIFKDLEILSKGKIIFKEGELQLNETREILSKNRPKKQRQKKQKH
jgi:hypothetical protein